MITLIDQIIINSKYIAFPIEITSKKTGITYLITKIDRDYMSYKQKFGNIYSSECNSLLTNWNQIFLTQLNKLLKELQQENIWED